MQSRATRAQLYNGRIKCGASKPFQNWELVSGTIKWNTCKKLIRVTFFRMWPPIWKWDRLFQVAKEHGDAVLPRSFSLQTCFIVKVAQMILFRNDLEVIFKCIQLSCNISIIKSQGKLWQNDHYLFSSDFLELLPLQNYHSFKSVTLCDVHMMIWDPRWWLNILGKEWHEMMAPLPIACQFAFLLPSSSIDIFTMISAGRLGISCNLNILLVFKPWKLQKPSGLYRYTGTILHNTYRYRILLVIWGMKFHQSNELKEGAIHR